MRRILQILFLLLAPTVCRAQHPYGLMQLSLDSVVVEGKRPDASNETTVGTRVSDISRTVLESNKTKSLSELLSDNTTVYIKSFGQGALATSSFRGTASSHTKVNWNGITINPSMSNSFDFSQIPVFFADNVVLYHGGGYLKNGTGALGGSINILNTPVWNDPVKLNAFAATGSFGTYTGAASVRFLRKKALYRTRIYHQQSENDFSYLNKVLRLDPFRERRKEASYKQTGIMQEAYFQPDTYSTVSSNLWLLYGDRRLPQPVTVNATTHERNRDHALRYYLGYDRAEGKHDFSAKGAYLLNILKYSKWFDNSDLSGTFNRMQSVQLKGDYRYLSSGKLTMGLSAMLNHDFVYAGGTSNRWKATRNTLDVQGSVRWNALNRLAVDAQAMAEWNDRRFVKTFSAGIDSPLVPGLFSAKAGVSYNYKFPSLNDLYWVPGGNPDLLPEKGFSYDATLAFTPKIGESLYFKAEATYYLMRIDDWIMWLPDEEKYGAFSYSQWRPRNVNNVFSHGLEWLSAIGLVLDRFTAQLNVNYGYSRSINMEKRFEEDGTYRKQLPYIPLHKANARLHVSFKEFFFSYTVGYTGKRYTSQDESYSTCAYAVHDAEAGYRLAIAKRYTLTPLLRINNMFNGYYESTHYYPMPLRNFSASVTLTF